MYLIFLFLAQEAQGLKEGDNTAVLAGNDPFFFLAKKQCKIVKKFIKPKQIFWWNCFRLKAYDLVFTYIYFCKKLSFILGVAHGHGRLWTPLLFDSKIAILFFIGFTFIYRTMAPIICHCMLRVQICIQSPALLPMVFILKFRLGDKCVEESAPCLFALWERAQVIRLPCWLNEFTSLDSTNFFSELLD